MSTLRHHLIHLAFPIASGLALAACGGGGDGDSSGTPTGAPDAGTPGSMPEPDAGTEDPMEPPLMPETSETTLAGLTVRITNVPARFEIVGPDGQVLLSSHATEGPVAGGPVSATASFRDHTPVWIADFGAFAVDEDDTLWHPVQSFRDISIESEQIRFTLQGDGAAGTGLIEAVTDGVLHVRLTGDASNRSTVAFDCFADEHFLGFGAHTHDVDHRGQRFPLWVSEQGNGKTDTNERPEQWFLEGFRHQTSFPVPFFLSSRGYGFLGDTDHRSVFDLCADGEPTWRYEAWESEVSFHVFYGPTPLEVIQKHTDYTGRAPVPPDFAFAPWNDAVQGSARVRERLALLRERDIPSSVMWTEDWAGSNDNAGEFSLSHAWEPDRGDYPDFEDLADELHAAGFKFLGYFSPFAYADTDHYTEGAARGYLVNNPAGEPFTQANPALNGLTGHVDLTSEQARDWMAGYMDRAIDAGLDGWMADFGEWMPVDATLASGEDPEAIHNRYPVLWQELNERVLGGRDDGVDRLVFVRSGYSGSQSIAHQVVWAADQSTDFDPGDGLPSVIPIGIGLGVVGMPYYGSDIAGYSKWSEGPTTKELYFRWTTLGALTPIMRTHHGKRADENWNLESDDESIEHFRRWARLHIQLFPYFRAHAQQAADTGAPLMRAMALHFPGDEATWGLTDQYMLGDSLLVAPVITKGATSREVYLPAGDWLPLEGGAPVSGPTTLTADAPISEIPVYVPAGSILSMLPDTIDTLAPATDPEVVTLADVGEDRVVRVYLGANGSFAEATTALTYELQSETAVSAITEVRWNDINLAACDAEELMPPCVDIDAEARRIVVYGQGDGTLWLGDQGQQVATLVTAGGAPERAQRMELMY